VARLVSIIGRSPGTLHTLLCLLQQRGVRPEDVVVLSTSREAAEKAVELASACPCPGGPPPLEGLPRPRIVELPYPDVDNDERLSDFQRRLARLLASSPREVLLDASGGRKAMTAAAAYAAAHAGATVVLAQVPGSLYREALGAEPDCRLLERAAREATLLRL
jgi:CRISPR-associated protein Csx14